MSDIIVIVILDAFVYIILLACV